MLLDAFREVVPDPFEYITCQSLLGTSYLGIYPSIYLGTWRVSATSSIDLGMELHNYYSPTLPGLEPGLVFLLQG